MKRQVMTIGQSTKIKIKIKTGLDKPKNKKSKNPKLICHSRINDNNNGQNFKQLYKAKLY